MHKQCKWMHANNFTQFTIEILLKISIWSLVIIVNFFIRCSITRLKIYIGTVEHFETLITNPALNNYLSKLLMQLLFVISLM